MEIANGILGFIFLILLLDLIGKIFKFNYLALRIAFSTIIFSFILTLLGFLNLLREEIILILVTSLYIMGLKVIKNNLLNYYHKIKKLNFKKFDKIEILLIFMISFYILITFINSLTPPIERDAINYHLYLPKMYLKNNSIQTIPENIYSFFPNYWGVFYTLSLTVSNDITAKLFHWLFMVLIMILIVQFLKLLRPDLRTKDYLCAILIFLSCPLVNKIASWAYLDLTFTFYALLSIYLILKFYEKKQRVYYYLSAFALGYLSGIKYLGWLWHIVILFLFLEKEKIFLKAIVIFSKFSFLAIIISCPFYLRNFLETSNPFFPFLNQIFKSELLNPEKYNLIMLYFQSFGQGISFKDLILLPYRLLFFAEFDQPQNFDGKIGLLYLIGIISILKKHNTKFSSKSLLYIIPIYTLFWFIFSQQLRFLLPVLGMISIIYGFYFRELNKNCIFYLILLIGIFYLIHPLKDFIKFKAWYFLTGRESKTEFLARQVRIYPMIQYINKKLPENSKIMLLDTGACAYYLDREVFQESIFEDYTFKLKIKESVTELVSYLKENRIDFILINEIFFKQHFLAYLSNQELENLKNFFHDYLKVTFRDKEFSLYKFNN